MTFDYAGVMMEGMTAHHGQTDSAGFFADKVYFETNRPAISSGETTEQYRRGYWDRVPLAKTGHSEQARPREVDWRARSRAQAARYWATDILRAKAIIRTGWRLHRRQNLIRQHAGALRQAAARQERDEALMSLLIEGAATDAVRAEMEVRHG